MEDRMTAQQLKNSILQMAVQGKLVPQDPNDEPASVLLERIRKEKEQLIKEGNIKKNKKESYIFRGADNLHYEQIGKEIKCIEDELPFEIPDSWEWVHINSIADSYLGKTLNKSKDSGISVPYLCSINIQENKINLATIKQALFSDEEREKYRLIKNDLLICEGGDVGRSAIWIQDDEMYFQNALHRVRFFKNIHPYFFLYVLSFFKDSKLIEKVSKGVTIKHFVQGSLFSLYFPLPPLNEQQRIVDKLAGLEPLIEKYKQSEEKLYKLNSNIKAQLKKSILQYAIEGKLVEQDLNDEPASVLLEKIHEEKEKLIAEGKIKRDKNESIIYRRDNSYYEKLSNGDRCIDEEIPYSIPDSWEFTRQAIVCWLDNGIFLIGEKLPYLEVKVIRKLKEPDIKDSGIIVDYPDKVILVDGENSGEVFIIPYKGYMGSTFKLLRQSSLMSEKYIQLIFELYRDFYKNSKKGAAIPHLNKDLFKSLLIPIPPKQEQERIVFAIRKIYKTLE